MTEKYQQRFAHASASAMPISDEESAAHDRSRELEKKRLRCFAYIGLFGLLQIIVILVFALVVMRVRTPKVSLENVTVNNSGSGNVRLTAQVIVKNTDFGHYEFESSIATLTSEDVSVGQFVIPEARARARSTKKLSMIVDINPGSGANSGVLRLISEAKLRGKVQFMKVLKTKKSADMSCTMSINLQSNIAEELRCK